MSQIKLHILGCGSAKPSASHKPSCQVLDFRNNLMMIDCGEGAQGEFMRQHLKFNRLNHIFLSHLHGDHCLGLPGLISTMALHGHGGKITIYTFEEGAEIFKRIFDVFCTETPFEIKFNIVDKKHRAIVYEDDALKVWSIPLKHRVPAVGYLFEEKPKPRHINAYAMERHGVPTSMVNRLRLGEDYTAPDGTVVKNEILTTAPDASVSYAYISDTAYSPKIVKEIEGVTWLYHESTYDSTLEALAKKRYHSTAHQAAQAAKESGAKRLILGHYSSRYGGDESVLLEEAKMVFDNTLLAKEGMCVELDVKTIHQMAE